MFTAAELEYISRSPCGSVVQNRVTGNGSDKTGIWTIHLLDAKSRFALSDGFLNPHQPPCSNRLFSR